MALAQAAVYGRSLVRLRSILSFIIVIAAAVTASVAQQATPTPVPSPSPEEDLTRPVSIKTDLVTLTLTVTDLYGRYVSGLTKNAFTIMDNGQEQEITFFGDSDAPVSDR